MEYPDEEEQALTEEGQVLTEEELELEKKKEKLEVKRNRVYEKYVELRKKKQRTTKESIQFKDLHDKFFALNSEILEVNGRIHEITKKIKKLIKTREKFEKAREKFKKAREEFQRFRKGITESASVPRYIRGHLPKFPTTVVVSINIHGGYCRTQGENFYIHKGKTLRTITAAPTGCVNFEDLKLTRTIQTMSQNWIKALIEDRKLWDSELTEEQLDFYTKNIAEILRKRSSIYQRAEDSATLHDSDAEYISNYSRLTSRKTEMFQTHKYLSTNGIPNKGLQIKHSDIIRREKQDIIEGEIKILNMPFTPNLADENWFSLKRDRVFTTDNDKYENITLKTLVEYLTQNGAKNIILIDLTCSCADPRLEASLTTKMKPRAFGGKNTKRRMKSKNSVRRRNTRKYNGKRRL
jgi:hypothetical protein